MSHDEHSDSTRSPGKGPRLARPCQRIHGLFDAAEEIRLLLSRTGRVGGSLRGPVFFGGDGPSGVSEP